MPNARVAAVIPCYREREHILEVLHAVPQLVEHIICVDDGCPEGTGAYVESGCEDPRVRVVYHAENRGVGAAMVTGYRAALDTGAELIVKLDGDGQTDPALIPRFVAPIRVGLADYTKGNRFYRLESLHSMPRGRLLGNALLSFFSKLSTGYWHLFDPNNGFTAIHADVLRLLPLDKLDPGYCFESDMLFRLNTLRAVVIDVPMHAVYGSETSHLAVRRELPRFVLCHLRNFVKRLFYGYFLRDFHVASVQWLLGPALMLFGTGFGLERWIEHAQNGTAATAGTVMLAALPFVVGLQLLLSALEFDIRSRPSIALHTLLGTGAPPVDGSR